MNFYYHRSNYYLQRHFYRRHFILMSGLGLIAFVLSACQQETIVTSTQQTHDHSQHQHAALDIKSFGDKTLVPALDFEITADAISGWNIHITTENFVFSPERINQPATAGEGHAHIFVDGYKFSRLYSPWHHLKNLSPGKHTVTITLNANDHSTWSHQGKAISASKTIVQPQ